MLVHAPSRRLILRLRDPQKVLDAIPTAKKTVYKGQEFVAVPHKYEEYRVLKNLNIKAPNPMLSYYDWPGLPPFAHQKATASFMVTNPRSFCLNDMGTGKTLSILWAWHYLWTNKLVGSLLVLCPLSTTERVWADEVFRTFPTVPVAVVHGSVGRKEKLASLDSAVIILNHDGIRTGKVRKIIQDKIDSGKIGVVAIDEFGAFRNAGTDRWRIARRMLQNAPFVWAMTGTPRPNRPSDAWAQVRLINPANAPMGKKQFQEATEIKITEFRWKERPEAAKLVADLMQPAIRYSRQECIELPPTTHVTRSVEMGAEQRAAFASMFSKCKAIIQSQTVTAVSKGVMYMKLLQIVCGTVYSETGNVDLPMDARLRVLKEVVDEASAKVIVFVPLTGALLRVANFLSAHYPTAIVHGGTPKSERDEIFSNFQTSPYPHVIAANPRTMSHGLTLTAADTIVWFAPAQGTETYLQANDRIARTGQTRNTCIVHLESSKVEREAYERLRLRKSLQDITLDFVSDGLDIEDI